jgi:hypothetical protein
VDIEVDIEAEDVVAVDVGVEVVVVVVEVNHQPLRATEKDYRRRSTKREWRVACVSTVDRQII